MANLLPGLNCERVGSDRCGEALNRSSATNGERVRSLHEPVARKHDPLIGTLRELADVLRDFDESLSLSRPVEFTRPTIQA